MKDLQGRPYATALQAVPGRIVQVDGDFTCLPKGAVRKVLGTVEEPYIRCSCGYHLLAGQLSRCGRYYVGLYMRGAAGEG